MIHARQDYNRFQEPFELLTMIGRLCSYIKSGEQLNEQDEQDIEQLCSKYKTLSEGSTPIADDEPVMLFRAQDRNFCTVVDFYAELCKDDEKIVNACKEHITKASEWQVMNYVKSPDIP